MRVGIIGLLHESNTFLSQPTTLADFENTTLLCGDTVRDAFVGTHHELGGFFAGLAEAGDDVQAVPLFVGRALPSGTVTAEAWDELLRRMFGELEKVGALDGLLVAPHGATVSAAHPDADGHWLSELRRRVGPDLPLIGTFDAHANLSAEMVGACDALVGYRSNPHLDQQQRGVEAARLLVRTVREEIRPVMRAVFPPLAINIERQMTEEPHLRPLYELADRQLTSDGVLSNSIVLGFPYADVAEMGSSVVVVTDGDAALAESLVGELAGYLWSHRQEFVGQLVEIEDALDRCEDLSGPVCLLDMGDNVGGGSAADGTYLAHALQSRNTDRAFVCLFDPDAVGQAEAAGVGGEIRCAVGGHTDNQHGPPLEGTFRVRSLHDGLFRESQVRHGGFTEFDQGRTAVVETAEGLTLMLTSKRMVPFSLQQLISCGLDPASFRILVAKGVNAPVAAYREVCPHLIRVNTPGSTCADMTRLEFHHRRRPMFPFEPETVWKRG